MEHTSSQILLRINSSSKYRLISIMMDEREQSIELESRQSLFKILEALHWVSSDFQPGHDPFETDSSAIKALVELRKASISILSTYPHHFSLSRKLSELLDLVQELHRAKSSTHGLKSFLIGRVKSHEIKRVSSSIESKLQALIDLETVSNLTRTVEEMRRSSIMSVDLWPTSDEEKVFDEMTVLQERMSRGFDINLQHLLLKSGVFSEIEWVLCNPLFSRRVRERGAFLIKELVLFNKDVFVGSVLVGESVKALAAMGSLQVLSSLIRAIRSPLVDEMESFGGVLKIVGYLSSDELEMKIMAMDCVMEIGYYGRKEAVEVMINGGLIKRLVELQRLEWDPFVSCVARFAVQLEVGEGLRGREKRAFKLQILSNIREACVSDAESATIVAEVLWGSTP